MAYGVQIIISEVHQRKSSVVHQTFRYTYTSFLSQSSGHLCRSPSGFTVMCTSLKCHDRCQIFKLLKMVTHWKQNAGREEYYSRTKCLLHSLFSNTLHYPYQARHLCKAQSEQCHDLMISYTGTPHREVWPSFSNLTSFPFSDDQTQEL